MQFEYSRFISLLFSILLLSPSINVKGLLVEGILNTVAAALSPGYVYPAGYVFVRRSLYTKVNDKAPQLPGSSKASRQDSDHVIKSLYVRKNK